MQKEIRCAPITIEKREEGTNPRRVSGYASVFDVEADLGFFKEVIRSTAFDRTLRDNPDIRALYQHDSSKVLGRTKADTLSLRTDNTGLAVEIDLPDSPTGNDALEAIRRGDVDQMSFGFIVREEKLIKQEGGSILREVLDVDLLEVSPVTWPAFEATSISAETRSKIEALSQPQENAPEEEPITPISLLEQEIDLLELELQLL